MRDVRAYHFFVPRFQTILLYHRRRLGAKGMSAVRGLRFVSGCRWGALGAMGGVGVGTETWAWSLPPARPRKVDEIQGDTP